MASFIRPNLPSSRSPASRVAGPWPSISMVCATAEATLLEMASLKQDRTEISLSHRRIADGADGPARTGTDPGRLPEHFQPGLYRPPMLCLVVSRMTDTLRTFRPA